MSRTYRKRVEKLKGQYPYYQQDWFVCERYLEQNSLSWYCGLQWYPTSWTTIGGANVAFASLKHVYNRSEGFFGPRGRHFHQQPLKKGDKSKISRFESDSGSKETSLVLKSMKKPLNKRHRGRLKQELHRELFIDGYVGGYCTKPKGSSINSYWNSPLW